MLLFVTVLSLQHLTFSLKAFLPNVSLAGIAKIMVTNSELSSYVSKISISKTILNFIAYIYGTPIILFTFPFIVATKLFHKISG